MSINQRLRRLERQGAAAALVCSACGHHADGRPLEGPYMLVIPEPELISAAGAAPVDTSRDLCGACGARVVFRLTIPVANAGAL